MNTNFKWYQKNWIGKPNEKTNNERGFILHLNCKMENDKEFQNLQEIEEEIKMQEQEITRLKDRIQQLREERNKF